MNTHCIPVINNYFYVRIKNKYYLGIEVLCKVMTNRGRCDAYNSALVTKQIIGDYNYNKKDRRLSHHQC